MAVSRFQVYSGLFFLLLAANTILSHAVARDFVAWANEVRRAEQTGLDPAEAVPVAEEDLSRGVVLMVTNLPLFAGLGWIVRAEQPAMGPLYWVLLLLGATYGPLIVTGSVYLLINAPKGPGSFPGAEPDGGPNDHEEDDDDDDTRST